MSKCCYLHKKVLILPKRSIALIVIYFFAVHAFAQQAGIDSFRMEDVKITIDAPSKRTTKAPAILIIYALPNGNTTEQTMGKKTAPGEDWHFNIQHIRAQTKYLRSVLPHQRIYVAYLENNHKSWPLWKRNHPDFVQRIPHIIDTVRSMVNKGNNTVYLNGHSGGGSFIFGLLDSYPSVPEYIERISFLDSNYGYDSAHSIKLAHWLQSNKQNALNVFAYNDSVALYNDKPIVSAKGGTWYKSRQMMRDLGSRYAFREMRNDSLLIYKNETGKVWFFLKTNPERKIFHTQQVEYNGFIHSILCGTALDSKGYKYYEGRVYEGLIE